MAIDDLDADGDIEIIMRASIDTLRVWDLPYSYIPENIDWPMFNHDPQHTGTYLYTGPCTKEIKFDGNGNIVGLY